MKDHAQEWSRREFLRIGAAAGAGAGASLAGSPANAQSQSDRRDDHAPDEFNEATIAQLQAAMARGKLSSVELTRFYLNRIQAIDERGPHLNSVIQVNPDALDLAREADDRRRRGHVRGPLDGIPVLLKDNIDTGDKQQTTAGSFALVGQPAPHDATVAAKLRAGGAVILGKANLSEWANFRSFDSSSGWSAVGGQCNNPYAIDRNPCGSSSGSGAAVSANLCTVALATETDGSIVCPAHNNGVVGIKPTVGVTSRAGVVPISHTQDTVGPHARTVADAVAVLQVIASRMPDPRDPATGGVPLGIQGLRPRPMLPTDYTAFLNPNGLAGARIGVTRQGVDSVDTMVGMIFDNAIAAMQRAGATIVDLDAASFTFPPGDGEFLVLTFEFVTDLRNYFATRVGVPLAGGTLDDLIAFDIANAAKEMPFFNQEIFDLAASLESGADTPQPAFGGMTYNQALQIDKDAGGINGIDKAMTMFNLTAIATPTGTAPWTTDVINGDHFEFATSGLAAIVGYPIVNVPMGKMFGLSIGLSFIGPAFSEGALIRVASGFEAVTHARLEPKFFQTLPLDVDGIPLNRSPRKRHQRLDETRRWRPHSM